MSPFCAAARARATSRATLAESAGVTAVVAPAPEEWAELYGFEGLCAVARIDSLRRLNGHEETDTRYAILSQLFDKPARREVIDFVDYMYSSQALLVAKGNPKNIKSLDDLSGVKVAAENGTTIQSLIEDQNKKFAEAGKPPAEVVVFPKDSDARQALQIGQVAVYGTTLESAAYFLQKAGHIFDIGGEPFAKILTGIAVRKGDDKLRSAIQAALDSMKADGTYLAILKKWGMEGDAI